MYRNEIIETLTRMLSGYDQITYNKLRADRKRTYIRAATTLWLQWHEFKEFEEQHRNDSGA